MRINIHHGGVLGSEAEEIQQLQAGNLDLALLYGVSNFQNLNPAMGLKNYLSSSLIVSMHTERMMVNMEPR